MKTRALAFAFIACLVSSLAFADNSSDAPLATDDGNTAMTQPQNCSDGKRRQQSNKDESASSKRKQKNGRSPPHKVVPIAYRAILTIRSLPTREGERNERKTPRREIVTPLLRTLR
jgi:hypothetical protein